MASNPALPLSPTFSVAAVPVALPTEVLPFNAPAPKIDPPVAVMPVAVIVPSTAEERVGPDSERTIFWLRLVDEPCFGLRLRLGKSNLSRHGGNEYRLLARLNVI